MIFPRRRSSTRSILSGRSVPDSDHVLFLLPVNKSLMPRPYRTPQAPSVDLLPPKQASSTYLPYNLFDVVLKVVRESSAASDKAKTDAATLERVIKRRMAALESLGR